METRRMGKPKPKHHWFRWRKKSVADGNGSPCRMTTIEASSLMQRVDATDGKRSDELIMSFQEIPRDGCLLDHMKSMKKWNLGRRMMAASIRHRNCMKITLAASDRMGYPVAWEDVEYRNQSVHGPNQMRVMPIDGSKKW
jgi:hypothetical protein